MRCFILSTTSQNLSQRVAHRALAPSTHHALSNFCILHLLELIVDTTGLALKYRPTHLYTQILQNKYRVDVRCPRCQTHERSIHDTNFERINKYVSRMTVIISRARVKRMIDLRTHLEVHYVYCEYLLSLS